MQGKLSFLSNVSMLMEEPRNLVSVECQRSCKNRGILSVRSVNTHALAGSELLLDSNHKTLAYSHYCSGCHPTS